MSNFQNTPYVHVVSFAPADPEAGGVGGFEWFRAESKAHAQELYNQWVQESKDEHGAHVVRLVPMPVSQPHYSELQDLTDEIEYRLDEVEGTAPATAQYVPEHTPQDHRPTGGVGASAERDAILLGAAHILDYVGESDAYSYEDLGDMAYHVSELIRQTIRPTN